VWVAYGAPIAVPAELDTAAEQEWGARLGRAIEALTLDLGARAGEVQG